MFITDLTVPPNYMGPTPASKLVCHGISPNGRWIGGTCLKKGTSPTVNTSQEFAYRLLVPPLTLYQAQPLGNDYSASCRGITDEGDRVGFHLQKPTDTTTVAMLRELNGQVVELPFKGEDSSANGATNKLIPGSLFIVGTHARPNKAAKGIGITFNKATKKFGPELNVCASMPTLPNIKEDVSVQCINSNGDIVANAVNSAQDQRQVVGFRNASNTYTWVPLLLPADPNNITVLGYQHTWGHFWFCGGWGKDQRVYGKCPVQRINFWIFYVRSSAGHDFDAVFRYQ